MSHFNSVVCGPKFTIFWSNVEEVVVDNGFYQRASIASYANRWYSQRRNVRLSVRLSHSGIVSKRRKLNFLRLGWVRHDFFTIREPEHSSFYKYLVHHEIR